MTRSSTPVRPAGALRPAIRAAARGGAMRLALAAAVGL
jgi:hypothetical protein